MAGGLELDDLKRSFQPKPFYDSMREGLQLSGLQETFQLSFTFSPDLRAVQSEGCPFTAC